MNSFRDHLSRLGDLFAGAKSSGGKNKDNNHHRHRSIGFRRNEASRQVAGAVCLALFIFELSHMRLFAVACHCRWLVSRKCCRPARLTRGHAEQRPLSSVPSVGVDSWMQTDRQRAGLQSRDETAAAAAAAAGKPETDVAEKRDTQKG